MTALPGARAAARQLRAVRGVRDGGRGARPRALLLRRRLQAPRPLAQRRYGEQRMFAAACTLV